MTPGRAIVVTGGVSGIGLATARNCLQAGWKVAIFDANLAAVREAGAALAAWPKKWSAHAVDVRDANALQAALDEAGECLGPFAGLVNCAAIACDVPFRESSQALVRDILDVNVLGSFTASRIVVEKLIEQRTGGAVVDVASTSGIRGSLGRTAYGASKDALIAMTKVMAVELAEHRIRVNTVAPGPIETPLAQRLHSPATRAKWESLVPLNRYGTSDEVAQVVRFLLDDATASYVNGQTVSVDGEFSEGGLLRERPGVA